MNELLVIGKGFLGTRIADFFNCPAINTRINTYEDLQKEIDTHHPQVLINCVGNFGKNVDDCEINKTESLLAHSFIPLLIAEAAIRNGLKMVTISSGCLYHYDYKLNRPITEADAPDFFDLFYSRTKIYAEAALASLGRAANILQLRIRMPLDYIPHPRNLLDKLLTFKSVWDIPNSATYVPDLLDAMKHLIKIDAEGIYNIVNYGGLRYRELLEEYRKYVPSFNYAIADLHDLKIVRTNLILSTDKLEESGFNVRDIHDVIPECVQKYIEIVNAKNQ